MSELIYKYQFGNEDMIGCMIKIYRDKDYSTNLYDIIIDFHVFDKKTIPKVITEYKIISYYIEELPDDDNILNHVQHNIRIKAHLNPRPETLFSLEHKNGFTFF